MRSINIVHASDSIALQFFDYYYSYKQSQNREQNYHADIEIKFNQPITDDLINVLVVDFERCFQYRSCQDFDLIMIDNRAEPLEMSSYMVLAMLEQHPSAYLLSGGAVHHTHPFYQKIISYNTDLYLFSDCISRPFYPQYWDSKREIPHARSTMCFINGQNRTWRRFFLDCMMDICGDRIPVRSRIHTYRNHATKLLDCAFESPADEKFKCWLNASVPNTDSSEEEKIKYYENSIAIGIDQKFGKVPPGYFVLDDYYTHHCIIYPEASWINHQLFLTEKTYKCCITRSIPWPISGSYCHTMMNDLGFMTARDLLPVDLQQFDIIEDHRERYLAQCEAIAWAQDHPEIWTSPMAEKIRTSNFEMFYHTQMNLPGIKHFDQLLMGTSKK